MGKLVPFSWYGGKSLQLTWLLPIINSVEHQTYVEPFGGSAAVLLNKNPSPVEVYNDVYGDVVNFFQVLRDCYHELIPLLELTPYSREEFSKSCEDNHSLTRLERARLFFTTARQVRTGLATTASAGRWAYEKKESRRGMSLVVSRWLGAIDGLEEVTNRLREVQVENLDATDVISRYDSEDTLHYLDPPYVMGTRSGGTGYHHEFDDRQHTELLELAKTLKGKVVLSGYASPLYRDILGGWNEHVQEPKISRSTIQSGNPSDRQEIVWTNY